VTAAEIEAQALALSQAQGQAVLGAEAFQGIAEAKEVPKALQEKALRLFYAGLDLSREIEAERRRVRGLDATCQDGAEADFGPTRPPPPPPPGVVDPDPLRPLEKAAAFTWTLRGDEEDE
jgi:hypothetical protein